jgi:hypothetical protein
MPNSLKPKSNIQSTFDRRIIRFKQQIDSILTNFLMNFLSTAAPNIIELQRSSKISL